MLVMMTVLLLLVMVLIVVSRRVIGAVMVHCMALLVLPSTAARSAELLLSSTEAAAGRTVVMILLRWGVMLESIVSRVATAARYLAIIRPTMSPKTVTLVQSLLLGLSLRVLSIETFETFSIEMASSLSTTTAATATEMLLLKMVLRLSVLTRHLVIARGRILSRSASIFVLILSSALIEANVLGEAIAYTLVLLVSPCHALIHALIRLVPLGAVEALGSALMTGTLLRLCKSARGPSLKRFFEGNELILCSITAVGELITVATLVAIIRRAA